jgi:hypothetical protein
MCPPGLRNSIRKADRPVRTLIKIFDEKIASSII